jgi:putative endonuclease
MKQYYIYIMSSKNNQAIYTGVTNNLKRRVFEHRSNTGCSFSKKYNTIKLVYYEVFDDVREAIKREKQIKGGSRAKKILLIETGNKNWDDLFDSL